MTGEIKNHETNRFRSICTDTGNQAVKIQYCSNKSAYTGSKAQTCVYVSTCSEMQFPMQGICLYNQMSVMSNIFNPEVQIVFLHSKNSLCKST